MSNKETRLVVPKPTDSVIVKSNYFIGQINKNFQEAQVNLTDYQKTIGMNAIMEMERLASVEGKNVMSFPPDNVYDVLQTIVSNELDPLNGHLSIILTSEKIKYRDEFGKTVEKYRQIFGIRPMAKGHIELVKKRATGINTNQPFALQPFVVYEGDEFRGVRYEGTKVIPPSYEPKYKSNKVMFVVYPLNMKDGTVQWVIGHRERVKPSIIAQAVNNGVPFEETQKMWDLSVDEILDTYANKTFKKELRRKGGGTYTIDSHYLNLTWRAKQNRESMVETKLRGVIAARMIDISHNNTFEREAFEKLTVEERYTKEDFDKQQLDLIDDSTNLIIEEEGQVVVEPKETNYIEKRAVIDVEFTDETQDNDVNLENEEPEELYDLSGNESEPQEEKEETKPEPQDDLFSGFGI